MKIALVHDYIKEMGGAERVLIELTKIFPNAPIYTSFTVENSRAYKSFSKTRIIESRFGRFLKIGKLYSYLRFLLPFVWKSLDLSEYDLVVTSCSGYIARGFKVSPKTKVVAYCHTPPRWLYGYETPTDVQNSWWGKIYLWLVGPMLRYFDYKSAERVDVFIANSHEVAERIKKFYRKNATVVYPPCEVSNKPVRRESGKYWLIVSRIVGGKGLLVASLLAKRMREKLVIIGTGDKKLEKKIKEVGGGYVEMKGWVADSEMADYYASAKGFLALAKDEDFGMTLVEAMNNGVPVLAYNSGGYIESVIDSVNGKLVNDSNIEEVMKNWSKNKWDKEKIVKSVAKFSKERFVKEINKIIKEL